MRLRHLVFSFASAALLGGCSFSLAQDVTPPPNSELSSEPVVTVVSGLPESPPDPLRGKVLFLQNCAPCHGIGGLGDGEQSGDLPVAVPAIGTTELVRASTPIEWFMIVSQGNLDNFMPPFAASLTSQQRWDVLAYVYSLSGEFTLDGSGNLVEVSDPVGTGSQEQTAVVEVRGKVINGSDGVLPAGAPITLYAYDHGQDLFTRTATLREDGEFQFDAIPLDARNLYQVSLEYKGLIYFSRAMTETELRTGNEFELTVYEGTQDTSNLFISSLNLVFDFLEEGQVKVVEQVLLSNSGDLAVVPAMDGQALLRYELPPDASNVSFEEGQIGDRYELVAGGFTDYRAVLPGENSYQVIYAFDLNYDRALDFVRAVQFPTLKMHIFLPQNEVALEGESLVLTGEQLVDGVPYRVYQLNRELAAGEQIALRLTGAHPLKSPFLIQISGNDFVIGLVALAVTVGIAWFWLRRTSRVTEASATSNQIMDAIIDLDEQFEKKEISENAYKQERARLKKRLRLALKRGDER